MSAELDMSQYLDLFLQEAGEQLEILEQETLKLEDDSSNERLQTIFRSAHTLKGSSRAMGFSKMAEVTHEMENILDRLRNHTLVLTPEITDALLGCQDTITKMVDSIASGEGDNVDCAELVARVQSLSGAPLQVIQSNSTENQLSSNVPESEFEALREAQSQGSVFHASFRLASDCVMKYVRAFMAINVIQEKGEVLVSVPDHEHLEEENFGQDFEFVFQSSAALDELNEKFAGITEIESFNLGEWKEPSLSKSESDSNPSNSEIELNVEVANPSEGASKPSIEANGGPKKVESGQSVRVDVTRLDNLMNLVGELVIDRTRLAQIAVEMSVGQNSGFSEALQETVGHIARITSDLQDQIMKARMMPIETVFNRFPRVVRDLAPKLGKNIKLNLEGGETELDRSVIEVISDPLLHILRNSMDHGIELPGKRAETGKPETGTITVGARHHENHIMIEIIDDGAGIDTSKVKSKAIETGFITSEQAARMSEKEALQLIFSSGLSTAKELSEVSGRGVGMDIVRSNIQRLGGIIDIETDLGKGTKITLKLPLTLAIIRGLLVHINDNVYVLPLGSVIETILVHKKDIQMVNKTEAIVIRGQTMPLVRLPQLFVTGKQAHQVSDDSQYVVIVGLAEKRVGLVVDRLIGEQEVVIKSLSRFCGDVHGISGATILGDGNVALIVDVNGIIPTIATEKAWH